MQLICFVDPDNEERAISQCCIRKQWQFPFFWGEKWAGSKKSEESPPMGFC